MAVEKKVVNKEEVLIMKSLVSSALGNKRADWQLPHMATYRGQLHGLLSKLDGVVELEVR